MSTSSLLSMSPSFHALISAAESSSSAISSGGSTSSSVSFTLTATTPTLPPTISISTPSSSPTGSTPLLNGSRSSGMSAMLSSSALPLHSPLTSPKMSPLLSSMSARSSPRMSLSSPSPILPLNVATSSSSASLTSMSILKLSASPLVKPSHMLNGLHSPLHSHHFNISSSRAIEDAKLLDMSPTGRDRPHSPPPPIPLPPSSKKSGGHSTAALLSMGMSGHKRRHSTQDPLSMLSSASHSGLRNNALSSPSFSPAKRGRFLNGVLNDEHIGVMHDEHEHTESGREDHHSEDHEERNGMEDSADHSERELETTRHTEEDNPHRPVNENNTVADNQPANDDDEHEADDDDEMDTEQTTQTSTRPRRATRKPKVEAEEEDSDEEEDDDGDDSPARSNQTTNNSLLPAGHPAHLPHSPSLLKKKSAESLGGSSCHQCKSRRNAGDLTYCTSSLNKKNKNAVCRKKYCEHCLRKFYRENPIPASSGIVSNWKCPSCRKVCCCAACRRREAKDTDPVDMLPITNGVTNNANIHNHNHTPAVAVSHVNPAAHAVPPQTNGIHYSFSASSSRASSPLSPSFMPQPLLALLNQKAALNSKPPTPTPVIASNIAASSAAPQNHAHTSPSETRSVRFTINGASTTTPLKLTKAQAAAAAAAEAQVEESSATPTPAQATAVSLETTEASGAANGSGNVASSGVSTRSNGLVKREEETTAQIRLTELSDLPSPGHEYGGGSGALDQLNVMSWLFAVSELPTFQSSVREILRNPAQSNAVKVKQIEERLIQTLQKAAAEQLPLVISEDADSQEESDESSSKSS